MAACQDCGRLATDPEFRITEGGLGRLSARIAVTTKRRDLSGDWHAEVSFFAAVMWGELAERLADRLVKGTAVFLSGRLKSTTWHDEENRPHSLVEIKVRNLQVLDPHPEAVEVAEEEG